MADAGAPPHDGLTPVLPCAPPPKDQPPPEAQLRPARQPPAPADGAPPGAASSMAGRRPSPPPPDGPLRPPPAQVDEFSLPPASRQTALSRLPLRQMLKFSRALLLLIICLTIIATILL